MKVMAIYANIEERVGSIHTNPLYSQSFLDQTLVEYQKKIEQL